MRFEPQRRLLLDLFAEAVRVAHPATCVPPHLPLLAAGERLLVLGAGKADAAMAQAVETHYASLRQLEQIEGFVTTRHGFGLPTRKLEVVAAGHPVPDAASMASAERTLAAAATAPPGTRFLILLSGGASALWSAPAAGVTADDKQALTRQLLRSGAPIGDMNTVRRHLSRIKGGRLLQALRLCKVLTLAISDVPRDEPEAIGSGPTVADMTTLADARAVLRRYAITPVPSIANALVAPANETLKPDALSDYDASFVIVARPKASLDAAAALAREAGYAPSILGDSLEGEARDMGRAHAALALDAKRRGQRVALLSGGEFTVTVTGSGRGGRSQEYAMGLAEALAGAPGISAIAADTDGIDGGDGSADDPAGALVVPDTADRARHAGLDIAAMLANNDSTAFFRALGDLVECGPTQTNVNDFRAILVEPA